MVNQKSNNLTAPFPIPQKISVETSSKKEQKKEEPTNKIVKSAKPIKQEPKPEYFTVKFETMMPVVLTYRILAESPEKAIEQIIRNPTSVSFSQTPQLVFAKMKKIKTTVYNLGTTLVRFIKIF